MPNEEDIPVYLERDVCQNLVPTGAKLDADTFDAVVNAEIRSLFNDREMLNDATAEVQTLGAKATSLSVQNDDLERQVDAQGRYIVQLEGEVAGLESQIDGKAPAHFAGFGLPPWVLRAVACVAIVLLLLAAFTVISKMTSSLAAAPIVDPDTAPPEVLEANREQNVPGLGVVRAKSCRYSTKYGAYIVEVDVTPAPANRPAFVGASAAYSSLTIGRTVLPFHERAHVVGAHDLDGMIASWARSRGTVGAFKQQIDRNAASHAAPGKTVTVGFAFRSARPIEAPEGGWARIALLFWSAGTLEALPGNARFGDGIVDAGYAREGDDLLQMTEPIRVDLSVPLIDSQSTAGDDRPTPRTSSPQKDGADVAGVPTDSHPSRTVGDAPPAL